MRQRVVVDPEHAPLAANGDNDMGTRNEELPLRPSMRAISYEDLINFDEMAYRHYGWWNYGRKTMRDINDDIIAPYCKREKRPYAQKYNQNGLKVGAFVTHCWDEPFADFVHSIQSVFYSWPNKPALWICSFALTQEQHCLKIELGHSIPDSPFVQADNS